MRMTRPLPLILSLALALIVGAGSLTQALARHQAHGAETLVICTGYGLVRITIDAEGNPVEQTLPCPDCVLGMMATLAQGTGLAPPVTLVALAYPAGAAPLRRAAPVPWPQSRAPPHPV